MIDLSFRKFGLLSLPFLAALTILFGVLGIAASLVYQSILLEVVLNLFLILPVSLVVARISTKSFLATGSLNVLLLGTAVFEFGVMAALGGFVSGLNPAEGISVYVMGALAAAFLHVLSGVLTYRGSPRKNGRLLLTAILDYVLSIGFALLISLIAIDSSILASVGTSGAFAQRVVSLGTVAMFFTSAVLFSKVYFRSRSPVLYWYSLALATTTLAFIAFSTTRANGDIATWTGIGGLCIGSVYFLRSVLAAPKIMGSAQPGPRVG